jgi:hypothetical protein
MKAELKGWVCPRCGKVHSPFVSECNCPSPTITSTTTGVDLSEFKAKMPSEEECIAEAEHVYPTVYKNDGLSKIDDAFNHMQLDKRIGFKTACEWFRNRMSKPNNSEGGWE